MTTWVSTLLVLAFISSSAVAATVYKKIDKDGNVVFSDTPMENAETLDVAPVSTFKMNTLPATTPAKKTPAANAAYDSLMITTPQADATFVNNMGKVEVIVQMKPKLRAGHQLQLLLNGVKQAGPGSRSSFTFSNLDRGSYAAVAQIVDNKGNVIIASPAVNFHIKRAFIRAQQ